MEVNPHEEQWGTLLSAQSPSYLTNSGKEDFGSSDIIPLFIHLVNAHWLLVMWQALFQAPAYGYE